MEVEMLMKGKMNNMTINDYSEVVKFIIILTLRNKFIL